MCSDSIIERLSQVLQDYMCNTHHSPSIGGAVMATKVAGQRIDVWRVIIVFFFFPIINSVDRAFQ